jgi:hypothetical protein
MSERRTATAALVILALVLCGCRSAPAPAHAQARAPLPRYDLAGESIARKVETEADVPPGPGAEGRPGDWVIENAFSRFIVASVGRTLEGGQGGNLIDAATQGGEDRMRLLVPELGGRPRLQPVYTDVHVEDAGGAGVTASVVATGHLPGQPHVEVTTTYRLEPDARMLEVRTTVANKSDKALPGFALADRLYQGRTQRFVPGAGFCMAGERSSAHWIAFCGGGYVWAVLGSVLSPTEGVHDTGSSELTYSTTDIAPGQDRDYRRLVLAEFGGPDKAWLSVDPVPEAELCSLRVVLKGEFDDQPVPGGLISVRPVARRPEFIALADSDGVAQLQLPAGRYEVRASAPGRPPSQTHTLDCLAGAKMEWSVSLSPAAVARLALRGNIGGIVAPVAGRVCALSLSSSTPAPGPGPGFPVQPPVGMVLVRGGEAARLPLAPASSIMAGSYMLVASKGPLFDAAVARVSPAPGDQPELSAVLQRSVDAGDYIAVDMSQRTDASPDCALSVPERMLADECEGLQAAVAADPVPLAQPPVQPPEAECVLLAGLRLERGGQGSFSVFPLDGAPAAQADLAGLRDPALSPAQVLQRATKLFPRALVQVDRPLDQNGGYFILGGFDRSTGQSAREGFGGDFSALELLSGGDAQAARDLLPYWFGLLNAGKRVLATGGSGSAGIGGTQAVLARTFVRCPTGGARPTRAQVVDAVRALKDTPDAFVTNGPFIAATLNGKPIGSRQTVKDGHAELRVRVYAPNWVDVGRVRVYRSGTAVQDVSVPESTAPLRFEQSFTLEAPGDCWFVVLVEGTKPLLPVYYAGRETPTPFAVTNPFWVEKGEGKE